MLTNALALVFAVTMAFAAGESARSASSFVATSLASAAAGPSVYAPVYR